MNTPTHPTPSTSPTLVTAVFDLGRERLASPFGRDADHYRRHLSATLAIDLPMVIYADRAHADLVRELRGDKPTRVIEVGVDALLNYAPYQPIETIRRNPAWLAQADWLPDSPQAALPGYAPLVLTKMIWLMEQTNLNPFGTTYFYWIDAGLGHTVPAKLLNAAAITRLTEWQRRFLFVCYPYDPEREVHGFDAASLARLAGVERTRWVARGGFFGGEAAHVRAVAGHYGTVLQETLAAGLMGTEESLFTLLSCARPELFDLAFIGRDGLMWPFFARLDAGWTGSTEAAETMLTELAETWFVSFNAPRQFRALLESIAKAEPRLLKTGRRVLINNSTREALFAEYDALCAEYGIEQIRDGNRGINGARIHAAELFYRGGRHAQFWFEDDMLLVPEDGAGLCTSGFPRHVPRVAGACLAIQQREFADYVKFNFTEVFSTHHTQWAWKNLDEHAQQHYFPGVTELPAMRAEAIRRIDHVSYAVAEAWYANWPQLVTRRGAQKLFFEERPALCYEQYWSARSFELVRLGHLRTVVLLASPVHHQRIQSYSRVERVEDQPLDGTHQLPAAARALGENAGENTAKNAEKNAEEKAAKPGTRAAAELATGMDPSAIRTGQDTVAASAERGPGREPEPLLLPMPATGGGTVHSFAHSALSALSALSAHDTRPSRPTAQAAAPTGRIFVSIANYRDSETPHTVRDLFTKAAHPERIVAGVFSQVVPGDDDDCLPASGLPASVSPGQLRELRVHAAESLGACWARSRILTELAGDEDWVLQIDSHMRFEPGWDERMIAMLRACPSPRALLTTYPTSYQPPDVLAEPVTTNLAADYFNDLGILLVRARSMRPADAPAPLPAAFLSANLLFGPAQAFSEVPYDPFLYFHGEEVSLAVRFWTHGWDLYAPNDPVMYHDYSADRGRPRNWDDRRDWVALNMRSFQRVRHLLGTEASDDPLALREIGRYGLGSVRTLAEYEEYADVTFATSRIGPRAADARFPPPLSATARANLRYARAAYLMPGASRDEVFAIETRSGPYSTLEATRNLRNELAAWLRSAGVRRLVDAGCGDFHWMSHMDLSMLELYVGGDIVPEIIEGNQRLYGHRQNVLFALLDVTSRPLPPCEAVLCRDLLNRLPAQAALAAIEGFRASGARWLIATTWDEAEPGVDAQGALRNLAAAPAGLGEPSAILADAGEVMLGVWVLNR